MKESTRKFYRNAWYIIVSIYLVLHFFFFKGDGKIVSDAMWANPWYGLTTTIFLSLIMLCYGRYCYLAGKESK